MGRKGYKHTKEAIAKIKAARAKQIITLEHRKKIGDAQRGNRNHFFGKRHKKETKERIRVNNSKYWKGKKNPYFSGKNNPRWKGGITPQDKATRNSPEYKLWRKAVFERDNWTCIWCGARSQVGQKVILHADHIKPFSPYPELRFAIDNGRTLCLDCHKTTDTWGGKIHGRE